MKILHYFLGFPPFRSGGSIKYGVDLMQAQVQQGDTVLALWPGQMKLLCQKTAIRSAGTVSGIKSYELVNPLPVPLDEGIAEPSKFMTAVRGTAYGDFLRREMPQVIHVHTLMGIHREFFDAARQLGIRLVFTTHDYFGICPKVTMYRQGAACNGDCQDCPGCNAGGLSIGKILLMQSPLYRILKNTPIVKQLRKNHRTEFFSEEQQREDIQTTREEYRDLRAYYVGMLEQVDIIHFNSSVTEAVYKKYLNPRSSRLISITHKNIEDNRELSGRTESAVLRLTYLASGSPSKGFGVVREACDALWTSGMTDFRLKVFFQPRETAPYMDVEPNGFTHRQLPEIFGQTDVLLAPSVWHETFGFTVLEALSFGVPVIVSENVGAKDIIGTGGLVIPPGDSKVLESAIRSLTPEKLAQLRQGVNGAEIKTWREFLRENAGLYED